MGDDDEVTVWLDTVREDQKRTKDSRVATRDELEEALAFARIAAGRCPYIVGTVDYPTAWDKAHGYLDRLLDQLVGR